MQNLRTLNLEKGGYSGIENTTNKTMTAVFVCVCGGGRIKNSKPDNRSMGIVPSLLQRENCHISKKRPVQTYVYRKRSSEEPGMGPLRY